MTQQDSVFLNRLSSLVLDNDVVVNWHSKKKKKKRERESTEAKEGGRERWRERMERKERGEGENGRVGQGREEKGREGEIKALIGSLANTHGVNNPTIADFRLPTI